MGMQIDITVKSLNQRVMWKVFDEKYGKISSLYKGFTYRKGKMIERSVGNTALDYGDGSLFSSHGIYISSVLSARPYLSLRHGPTATSRSSK